MSGELLQVGMFEDDDVPARVRIVAVGRLQKRFEYVPIRQYY
jgi:hypothetical protein